MTKSPIDSFDLRSKAAVIPTAAAISVRANAKNTAKTRTLSIVNIVFLACFVVSTTLSTSLSKSLKMIKLWKSYCYYVKSREGSSLASFNVIERS